MIKFGDFSSGGYIAVKLDPKDAGKIFNTLVNIPDKVLPEEMHCTLMYDERNPRVGFNVDPRKVFKAKIVGVKLLGEIEDSLALILESQGLTKEHESMKDAGFEHSFPELLVHTTVKYGASKKDLKLLKESLKDLPKELSFSRMYREKISN